MEEFKPEGLLLNTAQNKHRLASAEGLHEALTTGALCEAIAVRCDGDHNLYVEFPCGEGIIPREEGADGIAEGKTRDIALLARVGKPVCFAVSAVTTAPDGRVRALLSRREAQRRCRQEKLSHLVRGDILGARVTRLEPFGAFCDVGCGIPALLPIAALSVSRISHPRDRLTVGQDIFAAVLSADDGRLTLTMRELLGTWEENAAHFTPGETVVGIIRSVEPYGAFIELRPNLAGLAELRPDLEIGQVAAVYVKNILPDRMKIKLAIVDTFPATEAPRPLPFTITDGRLTRWEYSPPNAAKHIFTDFTTLRTPD